MVDEVTPGVSVDIKTTAPQGPWMRFQATPTVDVKAKPWETYSRTPAQATTGGAAPAPFHTDTQSSEGTAAPSSATQAEPTSALGKIFQPITSFPSVYKEKREAAQEQFGKGVSQIFKGQIPSAAWNTAVGGMGFVSSPIEAGIETFVGTPVEKNVGIPKEYTNFAAGLAIPYYGLKGSGAQEGFNKWFNPETMGAGKTAAASIRSEQGKAARDTAQFTESIRQLHPVVNALNPNQKLDLIGYIEGTFQGPLTSDVQKVADTLKQAFDARKAKLGGLTTTATMNFIDEYFPHMWKDPKAAQNFVENWGGAGKQGSGASLKKRSIPTIADGIKAGLQPVSDNPLEISMRYVNSMDKFIASTQVLEEAVAQGTIKYSRPKIMGASGHPQGPSGIPPGYSPLKGRGATDATGRQAYAPDAWARVYNNFIGRGAAEMGENWGKAAETAIRGSNTITALELGLSGYHLLTMAQEGAVNEVARAFEQASAGKAIKAARTLAGAPFSPITLPFKGHKAEKIYLGVTQGTAQNKNLVDLLTEAGARMKGKAHSPDYQFSGMGSLATAFKRGSLKFEMMDDAQKLKLGIKPASLVVMKNIGRVMDTVMQPLFEQYIPKLKNGAAMENLKSWIDLHPNSTRAEQLEAARAIWDSIDNRFGEMVQDNIFWDKTLKQLSMASMRSYSWNLGTVREIGGGVKDVLEPKAGGELSQRTAYTLALPIVYGTVGAVYQYLKTGQAPQDAQDLIAPRTGGTTEDGLPERIIPPGYMKDVFGWADNPRQEATNKLATAPRLLGEMIFKGTDWRGDPIAPPEPGVEPWMHAYFDHIVNNIGPISLRNMMKKDQGETGLSKFEKAMGLQPAGKRYTDPEGFSEMMRNIDEKKWRAKQRHDQKTYGGTDE